MKKVFSLLLIVGICSSLIVGCSTTKQTNPATPTVKVMKIGSVNAKERSLSKGLYKFAEVVERESKGTIKVEVYTDGVLGDDRRSLEGLQIGSLQGTVVSTGVIASFVPTIAIFDLPFLFEDRQTAYKILDGKIGRDHLATLEKASFIGLEYWENGFRHLSNSRREVTTLEDMKGLKIRTIESAIHVDIWKALGTNPTPLSMSQLYTALEQKVVDGQENPLGGILGYKFDEIQKYIALTGHVYNASPFMISKVFWNTLSDNEKDILKKAAAEARDYQRKLSEEEDKTAAEAMTKNGVKISELKPGEKGKMRSAVQPVYEKYKATFGEAQVKELIEATAKK